MFSIITDESAYDNAIPAKPLSITFGSSASSSDVHSTMTDPMNPSQVPTHDSIPFCAK